MHSRRFISSAGITAALIMLFSVFCEPLAAATVSAREDGITMEGESYLTTETFSNRVRSNSADPWMFWYEPEGVYYLFQSGDYRVKCRTAKTLTDMGEKCASYTETVVVNMGYNNSLEYGQNLWSPEVHYFSAEDFGEQYAGWYMFIAADNGSNVNHRMYVLKSVSDSPSGPYGNPITGQLNVPEKVVGKTDKSINSDWSCGETVLRVGDKVYAMWVGENGRGTANFDQYIYIAEMENPWTFLGSKSIICRPTKSWEMVGSGWNGTKYMPKVVEGGTAVYGPNGEIFVIYSGSGYWTNSYCLGQLKLVGDDPTVYSNWVKKDTPILQARSDYSINGCGHASYLTSPSGKYNLIAYHAYTEKSRESGRSSFVDYYTVTSDGVVIGDGSTIAKQLGTKITVDTADSSGVFGQTVKIQYPDGIAAADVTSAEINGIPTEDTRMCVSHFEMYLTGGGSSHFAVTLCAAGKRYYYAVSGDGTSYTALHMEALDGIFSPVGFSIRTSGARGMRVKTAVLKSALSGSGYTVKEAGTLAKLTSNESYLAYIISDHDDDLKLGKSVALSASGTNMLAQAEESYIMSAVITGTDADIFASYSVRPYVVITISGADYAFCGNELTQTMRNVAQAMLADPDNGLPAAGLSYIRSIYGG